MSKKGILMILDGWGIGKDPNVSAVELAKTPNIDKLIKNTVPIVLELMENMLVYLKVKWETVR